MRRSVQWRRAVLGTVGFVSAMLVAVPATLAADGRELGRVTARAAIVMDAVTGEVHFARNPTLPVPPASTTKVLTALIALRELSPDTPLHVSRYASSQPPSKAWLKAGWELTARDVVYAMLLRSANDASVVLAEAIAGSVPSFARRMNATARALGATDSTFVTPNGLPAPGHRATAHDLALILRAALQTPGMRDILSTRTATIRPLDNPRKRISLRSTNRLLWRDDLHVIGKTGWTREAKRCFLGAASANGREVIVAVLGSNDLWGDVETLATYGLEQASLGGSWREAGWQQASAAPLRGTAWSRPGSEIDAVAPPPGAVAKRAGRRTVAKAPTSHSRTVKKRGRTAVAQGDRTDPRRTGFHYAVDVASFRSKARAEQLRKDLAKRGYRAQVQAVAGRYRVRLPSFPSRAAAQKAARTLSRTMRVDPVVIASR